MILLTRLSILDLDIECFTCTASCFFINQFQLYTYSQPGEQYELIHGYGSPISVVALVSSLNKQH